MAGAAVVVEVVLGDRFDARWQVRAQADEGTLQAGRAEVPGTGVPGGEQGVPAITPIGGNAGAGASIGVAGRVRGCIGSCAVVGMGDGGNGWRRSMSICQRLKDWLHDGLVQHDAPLQFHDVRRRYGLC